MRQQPRLQRSFLFLQGPHGSFFPKLGRALAQTGHRVRRINLNGGDRATWPTGDDFHGLEATWRRYLARYLRRWKISDLVLFGDNRPHHVVAIEEAKRAGIRIHVFEEGYIRPDWVTLERNGVNGHSPLPRDADWYRHQANGLGPVPVYPPVPSYATARGWAAFFYYAEVVLQHWRFPFGSTHRDRNPVWEGIRFLRRFRLRDLEQRRTAQELDRLGSVSYVLFPLQLNSDFQIRIHSPFGSMHAAIDHVLTDFARHAPPELHLVVKEHPLDSGLTNWRNVVESTARHLGISKRIIFLEQGDLSKLVEASHGMVTVNSTSGTLALAAGKPVKVLGTAVYDIKGITDSKPLERFWSDPTPPDPQTYEAFYRVLVERCLIPGAFLSNVGIDRLVSAAVSRLISSETDMVSTKLPTDL